MMTMNRAVAARIVGAAVFLGLGAVLAQADVGIRPAYVEVDLRGRLPSGSFIIANTGDKEERYRVNAVHFTYSEEGGLSISPTGDRSLAPWIRFNPRDLTLPPNSQRAVRFAVVPRGQLKEGEYWAAMELENLATSKSAVKDEKSGKTVQVRVTTSILAPIFGTVGNVTYEAQIKDLQVRVENGAAFLTALVAAAGTGRLGIKSDYEIANASGTVVNNGALGAGYVIGGCQRRLRKQMEVSIPPGSYTVKISCTADHLETPVTRAFQVTWPDVPPAPAQPPTAGESKDKATPEKPKTQPPSSTDGGKQSEVQGSANKPGS